MNERPSTINPRHSALLVMDYQAGVLGRLSDPQTLLSRAAEAIEIARRRGAQVGYVRVAFDDADYDAIPAHSQMAQIAAAADRAFHTESPSTAIHERLAPQANDIIVRKTRVGAFSTTDLDSRLRDRGIMSLILAGISTSGVVLSTVRDAADRDYQLFVLADACADFDPQVHEFLIEKVFPRQAHIINIPNLEGLLSPAPT